MAGVSWEAREEERSWQALGRLRVSEDLQPSHRVGLCPRENGELLEVLSRGAIPLALCHRQ